MGCQNVEQRTAVGVANEGVRECRLIGAESYRACRSTPTHRFEHCIVDAAHGECFGDTGRKRDAVVEAFVPRSDEYRYPEVFELSDGVSRIASGARGCCRVVVRDPIAQAEIDDLDAVGRMVGDHPVEAIGYIGKVARARGADHLDCDDRCVGGNAHVGDRTRNDDACASRTVSHIVFGCACSGLRIASARPATKGPGRIITETGFRDQTRGQIGMIGIDARVDHCHRHPTAGHAERLDDGRSHERPALGGGWVGNAVDID